MLVPVLELELVLERVRERVGRLESAVLRLKESVGRTMGERSGLGLECWCTPWLQSTVGGILLNERTKDGCLSKSGRTRLRPLNYAENDRLEKGRETADEVSARGSGPRA